jgi:hypothetical protein
MSDTETTAPKNPFEGWPLHHLLFVKVRDGGGPHKIAQSVADLHGITLDDLKARCRMTGEEWLARDGELNAQNQPVYDWARS